jgi:predicted CXXCH cytochrome family protein
MRKIGLLSVLTIVGMLSFSAVALAATDAPLTTDPASQGFATNGTGVGTTGTIGEDGTAFTGQSYRMDTTTDGALTNGVKTGGNGGTSYDSPVPSSESMKYDSPNNAKIHSSYSKTSDACASCHTIHTSVNQGALLQWENPQTACWACHDGTVAATYDVINGTHNDKTTGAVQVSSAGLFGNGDGTEPGLSNHGMSPKESAFVTTAAAPGGAEGAIKDKNGDWNTEFTCVACHDPHGTLGNARILNPNVNGYADMKRAEMAKTGGETLTTADQLTYQATAGMWMGGHGFDATVTVDGIAPAAGTYTVDSFNGRIKFATAQASAAVVKATYSPGLVVKMDVAGKLTSNETVKYQSGLNQFCGACHTDYNNVGKTGSGTTGVGGAYNVLLGEYSKAYRHSVGFTRTADSADKTFTNTQSLDALYPGLKFDTSNPKVPGTVAVTVDCLTCHYAHGTSDKFIQDSLVNQGQIAAFGGVDAVNATGDKILQTYDTSRTTALKRLPNMGVCQACHNKTGATPVNPG